MSAFRQVVLVRRFEPGSYVDGEFVEGANWTFDIEASIQPVVGNELEVLPEGRRDRETFKLYTAMELLSVSLQDHRNPDRVNIFGSEYEVFSVEPWRNNIRNHYKVIVQRAE